MAPGNPPKKNKILKNAKLRNPIKHLFFHTILHPRLFFVVPWLSLVNLTNVQTLGATNPFLIILWPHTTFQTLEKGPSWGPTLSFTALKSPLLLVTTGTYRYRDRWKWFLQASRSFLNPPGPWGEAQNLSFRIRMFKENYLLRPISPPWKTKTCIFEIYSWRL